LSLPTVDLALARVRERVRSGGHEVPAPVVRRRYVGGLRNFFTIYQHIADRWQLFDNSDASAYRLIAYGGADSPPEIVDYHAWNELMRNAR
jgi:predicted ABC-type ATPase